MDVSWRLGGRKTDDGTNIWCKVSIKRVNGGGVSCVECIAQSSMIDAKNVVLTNHRGTRRSSRALWWTRPKSSERWLPDAWRSSNSDWTLQTNETNTHQTQATIERRLINDARTVGQVETHLSDPRYGTCYLLWCNRVATDARADERFRSQTMFNEAQRYPLQFGPEHAVCSR